MNTFAKKLENLINVAGYEVTVEEHAIEKNNGVSKRGYIINEKGHSVSPTIYYDENQSESENLQGMFDAFIDNRVDLDLDKVISKKYVLSHLTYKLIDQDRNEKLLKDCPHTDFLDLSKVYVIDLGEAGMDKATILIHNSHLARIGITLEELEKNATNPWGFSCKNIGEYLSDLMGMPAPAEMNEAPMYIVTNEAKLFGAGLMTDSESMKKVSEITGMERFIILPSSIHEIIVVPDEREAKEFANLVKSINQTEVAEDEVLSDSVYLYNGKEVTKVA